MLWCMKYLARVIPTTLMLCWIVTVRVPVICSNGERPNLLPGLIYEGRILQYLEDLMLRPIYMKCIGRLSSPLAYRHIMSVRVSSAMRVAPLPYYRNHFHTIIGPRRHPLHYGTARIKVSMSQTIDPKRVAKRLLPLAISPTGRSI